jgi:hypothetical protein
MKDNSGFVCVSEAAAIIASRLGWHVLGRVVTRPGYVTICRAKAWLWKGDGPEEPHPSEFDQPTNVVTKRA